MLLLIKGLGLGGAERLVVDVIRHRDRGQFDYEVAYVLSGQDALVSSVREAGVPTHDLGAPTSTDLRWMLRLRRLLRTGRFDVLHSHLPYSAAMGRLVALSIPRGRRPALVYTEHSLWNKAAVVTKALNSATVGLDQALFVVSTTARDALPSRLRARAQVVVHGVDRARFGLDTDAHRAVRGAVRAELGVLDDEILALTVANLRSEKGYDVLLEVARLTAAQGGPVRFVSVGRGPLEDSLRAEAAAAGLNERFALLGPRTDVVRLMAGADVFVLPSHQEGLPVALMEAMSAGLAVVVTAVGGVPDIVTDGIEGFVVPPGRPELLADALAAVASDPSLRARLGDAARARSEQFDVARAVEAIETTYARILRDHVPLVLHVIPTATARGAQREARALVTRLDVPGTRHHRLMSLFAGPLEVPVDYGLDHPGGERPAVGFDRRLARRLRTELRRLRPTVVVAHGGDPLKYLVPASLGRSVPLAYYATGTFAGAGHVASETLWRALVRQADVVACEGDEVLEECRTVLGVPQERLVLAPNGRDPEEFHPPEGPAPASDPRAPVVVFVGALTPGKRPARFIEVVAALRHQGVELHAVACGDGPLRADLVAPAAAADVELLGSRSDVADVLRGADVLVFPSLPTGEGMPGVLIEAGLTGLPVVASCVPGVRTIVEDGVTGFVVDPDDSDAMVEALARLLAVPELRHRMGSAARQRCVTRFSLDSVAACWLSFLEPLVVGGVRDRDVRSARGTRPARGG